MRKLIISILVSIILFISAFNYIQDARNNRIWPFNSGLSNFFLIPEGTKKLAYEITNPNKKTISTHYYKLNVIYFPIPSKTAEGGGGAINLIKDNKVLVTLNNLKFFLFDLTNFRFNAVSYKPDPKIESVRDVHVIRNKEILLVLGVIESNSKCKKLILFSHDYSIYDDNININNKKYLWESEQICDNPISANAGARIIYLKDSYYVSTGFFGEDIAAGINEYPQADNSSFGKIIKIDIEKNSTIFAKGLRNPQGLFYSKNRNLIFATDHGPSGGDELNIIEASRNYGWPCKTLGTLYSYKKTNREEDIWPSWVNEKITSCSKVSIFQEPFYSWTPSIAVSQGFEYHGDHFRRFKNNLIIGSLIGHSIFRIMLSDNNMVINVERININERIRDIIEVDNGKILVYSDGGSLIMLSK